MTTAVGALAVRVATAADEPFLRQVYASTRGEELAGVSWGEATRKAFLHQQFDAQAADYRRRYPDAAFLVVELDDMPIGRLYVADDGSALHVLDIALLPEHRGAGHGQVLLHWVIGQGRPVSLSVGKWNRAQRLYARLGFEVVADCDPYIRMERLPLS